MSESDTGTDVAFFVLGAVQVRDAAGEIVAVTADKPRRLLTKLLLRRNTWVDTDALVEALWGDARPPASARGNLKTYVHQLRQLLPGDGQDSPITSRRGSYLLTVPRGKIDSDVFEELIADGNAAFEAGDAAGAAELHRRALGLWRGDPDPEVADPGATAEAARLRELRWVARDGLTDALVGVGQPDQAVAMLRGLTTEEPLREATWARLVSALRAAGRPADALAAYQEYRDNLVAELGAEPGGRLRALHATLLADTQEAQPSTDAPGPVPMDADPAPRPARPRFARRPVTLRAAAVACALALLVVGALFVVDRATTPDQVSTTRHSGPAPVRSVPGYPAGSPDQPKLLFGLGSEAVTAARQPLATETPVGMLSTWYDGPEELPKYQSWRDEVVPGLYAEGKALHLVVVPDHEEKGPVDTEFGPGCGNAYALSPGFLDDMRELATAFAGTPDGPPLYVSMFNSLDRLVCSTGYREDPPATNYYNALKQRYLEVREIFHRHAPNARVALNFDGWQASWDDPEIGAGRSLIEFFSDALAVSDFQSFSAFEAEDNSEDVTGMVDTLSRFGPVMVTNFGPNREEDPDGERLRNDLRLVFEPDNLARLTEQGLFAWTFWEQQYLENPASYLAAKNVVQRFARP